MIFSYKFYRTFYFVAFLAIVFSYSNLYSQNTESSIFNSNPKSEKEYIIYDFNCKRPTVAFVLSGGGARGIAQVGVLSAFEQAGIKPDYIVGASIGSIVGGLYASGYKAPELEEIVSSIDWRKLIITKKSSGREDLFLDQKQIEDRNLITLRFKNFKFVLPDAISAGDEFNAILQRFFWNSLYRCDGDFNKLKYPFRAVATDLISGTDISQKSGNIIKAVRASSTMPLRFTPVRIDGMVFVDGGILANIPVNAAKEFKPDIIIAINSTSPLHDESELNTPWNIADQAVSIAMRRLSDEAAKGANFVITPQIGKHKNTDFTGLDSLIYFGKKEAIRRIPAILNKIRSVEDSLYRNELKDFFSNSIDYDNVKISLSGFKKEDSIKHAKAFVYNLSSMALNDFFYSNLKSGNYKYIKIIIKDDKHISFKAEKYPVFAGFSCKDSVAISKFIIDSLAQVYLGTALNPEIVSEIKEYIIKEYRKKGFSIASIKSLSIRDSGIMDLTFDEGILNSVKIFGAEETSDFLIKREINYIQNEPFNSEKIFKGWNNLMKTDLFTNVDFEIKRDTSGGNDLIIKVSEGGTQTLRIGARVDGERYAQVGIESIQDNLFNFGMRASLRFAGGARNSLLSLALENPRIFSTQMSFSAKAYISSKDINLYKLANSSSPRNYLMENYDTQTEKRIGAIFSIGTQIERSGLFSVDYRYEKQKYENGKESLNIDYYTISTLKFGALFDSRNRADFPTEGRLIELSLETSLFSETQSNKFAKAVFNYVHFQSLGASTFKTALYFGAADKTLPNPELFSLGGEANFYGMRESEERGRQMFNVSLQYRLHLPFQLFFDTYVAFDYNLGSVWGKPELIKIGDMKHGFGTSLMFDTPVGPARFSVGKAFLISGELNSIVWGETLGYFSIGMNL